MPRSVATYLSTRQAAKVLGVSLRSVQLWVESGVLRAWKTAGGHRRIPLSCLEEVLRTREQAMRPDTAATPGGFKVLLIEDDLLQTELIAARLAGLVLPQPVELQIALDGYLGLLALGENLPDLLLLDLGLPRFDGFALLRALRAAEAYQTLPVIVISSLSVPELAARGGLPPGVEFMRKPLDFTALADRLATLMQRLPTAL